MVVGWTTLLSVWLIAQMQESLCQEQVDPGAIQGPTDKPENVIQNNFLFILHIHFLCLHSHIFSSNKWCQPQLHRTEILLESLIRKKNMIRKKTYNIYLSYVFIFKSITEHVQTKALYKTEYRFSYKLNLFPAAAPEHAYFPFWFFHHN